ncbi:NAD(P)-dependent oxidoreductase [Spiribacter sp. 1M153]|uniref:NAD(P)-dependent oxidoreductase n=1 Tax=Spiribacter roseus TaxID=1855875 RepID=UPI00349F64F6
MLVYKATNTLDGYLPPLDTTDDKAQAEVMVVGGKKIVLDEFPKLRGIFKTGVGIDNLPFAEAAERGVEIALPSDATCDVIYEETAAFTCHLILNGLYAGGGDWDTWRKVDRPQLAGRHLLVIGAGRIGQRVIDKMRAFMQVDSFDIAYDPAEALETKIRAADCVSLHVPLTDETRKLFNAERLGWMLDGALLVNTARGPVIDEDALYAELSAGRLRAAIDVFWQEPYRGKLTELPADRFIRTPHIASTCKAFVEGTARDFLSFMMTLESR